MVTYLAKLGELTLKGSNLHEFEKLLSKNTRESLKGYNVKITLHAGRLYIDCEEQDCEAVEKAAILEMLKNSHIFQKILH